MLYFANPWALLGLLSLPTIAFIHLYQRRYPPLQVAGLHLWANEKQVRMPGRKRERLPITKTLILELLAALVLSLVMADPRVAAWDRVTHLVAILDHSASMLGEASAGRTYRDVALDALEQRLQQLDRNSVVTLIRTGSIPITLCRRATLDEARKTMADWQPGAPTHRLASAWEELGRQFVDDGGRMLFLTDTLPLRASLPANLEVVAVGRKTANVAINAARWTFDQTTGKGEIYIRLQNTSPTPLTGVLKGQLATRQAVFEQKVTLNSQQAAPFTFTVPGGLQRVDVEFLCAEDGLPIDNRVTLIEPHLRSVKVAVNLPEGAAKRLFSRVLKVLPEVTLTNAEQAQLQIAPAATSPPAKPQTWFLGVGPLKPEAADRKAAKDLAGPFLLEKRHALLEGITLGGVVWGGVQPLSGQYIPLISTGSNTLLAQLRGLSTTGFVMNLDFTRTNLPESPDWPVLMNNLLEMRRDALPGLRRWNYRLGEVVRLRLYEGEDPRPDAPVVLKSGAGTRTLTRESVLEISGLDQTAIYELTEGTESLGQFAVNFFDATESNLQTLSTGEIKPQLELNDPGILIDNSFSWLLWLATAIILGFIVADWYVLKPQRVL